MLPEYFLEISKEWSENKSDCEAHTRSAISRAYYAAFHHCVTTLQELGIPADGIGGAHQKIIDALKESGDKELAALSHKLKDLKVMRESADYQINFPLPSQNHWLAIRKAENILERCNEKTQPQVGT
ncbi:hypothetical protein ACJO5Y_03795 [Marinobacter sp. GN3S48]|uniref:hypothetical protein n=1 Tax=Marinobacter sp. GN3S48 TaxID=3382302 RepID=UPI00387B433F